MKGNRIGVVTPTGAGAIMIIDALGKQDLKLAKLSKESVNKIKNLFPVWSPPSNPVDIMAAGIAHGYKNAYKASLEALLEDENVDAVLCIAGIPTLKTIKGVANGSPKPVVTWVLGNWVESLLSKIKETNYKVVYPTPERAVRAIAALRYYSDFYKPKQLD
jgi:acetyltransferase